jgi:hypothetical protein
MKRRAQRPQSSPHDASPAHPTNHSRALVHVDGTGIRKKIKKDYEKALRDLENARRQLDQFQETDQPQFTRWLNSHFGALLTELRELSQKLAADEELIFQVEREAYFGQCSEARAYQQVVEFRENPEPPQPGSGGRDESDREPDPFGARAEPGADEYGEEDPIEEFMNALFGNLGSDPRARGHDGRWGGQPREAAAPAQRVVRLKELYRAVVRRLHPDTQGEMTPQKTEWWHQAQAAYEAGDVEQMEVILTLCEIGENGTTAHTSASLLQRITAQLKHSVREIKRQLSDRRRDPAWNFTRRTDHDVLAVQMRREFTGDLERMRQQWRTGQEVIAGWKAAAERLKQPRRRKKQPRKSEFPF